MVFLCLGMVAPLAVSAQEPDELYREARDHLQNEEYSDAREQFERFTDNYPNHPRYWDAYFGFGQSLYRLNNLRRANQVFASVRRNHPDQAVRGDALFGQIQIGILQDKVAMARALSESFMNLHSDHILHNTVRRQLKILDEMEQSRPSGSSSTDSPPTGEEATSDTAQQPERPERSSRNTSVEAPDKESDDAFPPLRFKDGLIMPALEGGRSDPGTDQSDQMGGEPEQQQSAGEIEDHPKYQKIVQKNDQQRQTIEQLNKQITHLNEQNELLRQDVDTLKHQLERKITNLAEDTELHRVSREIDFSDTAEETLNRSLEQLRRKAREAFQQEQYQRARSINQQILDRSPTPDDYVLAARITSRLGEPKAVTEEAFRQAIELGDPPRPAHLNRYAEWLLDDDRLSQLENFFENHHKSVIEQGTDAEKARWSLLRGKYQVARGQTDSAFFHLMEAIRLNPESPTAGRARAIIQDEF